MVILAMVEQIPGGVKHQAGAELTIIRDPRVKLHDMLHSHPITLEIPVTFLALNLVLTVLFYLTYHWVPLVGKSIQFWVVDHFHCFGQVGVYHLGYFNVRISLWTMGALDECLPGSPGQPVGWSFTRCSTNKGSETNPTKHMSQKKWRWPCLLWLPSSTKDSNAASQYRHCFFSSIRAAPWVLFTCSLRVNRLPKHLEQRGHWLICVCTCTLSSCALLNCSWHA